MRGVVITVVVVLAVLAGTALSVVYTGAYDVRASTPHTGIVAWALASARERAVAKAAADVEVPALDEPGMREAGFRSYRDMCAGCHAPPGGEPSPAAEGLSPVPPEMAEIAEARSAAEIFWVTKHGLRMTGMPAWGATHDDASLWRIVAFVRELPQLSPGEYREMARRLPAGHGHGGDGEAASPEDGTDDSDDSGHHHGDGHAHEHEH